MALRGAKGEILFQKRTSPFESPKRKVKCPRLSGQHKKAP